MLVFEERGNRSTRRKIFGCRVENQQTQPTYDAESGNRTRATLVGGAIPAPPVQWSIILFIKKLVSVSSTLKLT